MKKSLLLLIVFFFSAMVLNAQRTITGKITDENGVPLTNVSVTIKGSSNKGVLTKADGSFSLSIPANARQLEISYVGKTTQTVNISSSNSVYSVTLQSETRDMAEVVVTGLSRMKKSEFTGAVNRISPKELTDKPVGSFDQLLQGRVPGVLALTTSGQPGNATAILIRGTNSIVGGSTPLYILDGIPVEPGVFQGLNPNDFASIDIARDAATTSLYGSRGSAGVVIITSKRGVAGKMKLSYNGQYGMKSKPEYAFRPMNTTELLKAQEDYGRIVGGPSNVNTNMPGWYYSRNNPRYATLSATQQARADFILDSISKINTDWKDQFFQQGSVSNHQISLSGGTGKTRIYSSAELYNETGITTRTSMQRASIRNNMDYADDKFTFSVSSSLGYTKRSFQQSTVTNDLTNPFLLVNIQVPYALVYKPDGSYSTGLPALNNAANLLDITFYDKNYNDQLKAIVGITTSYKLTNDITAGITAGFDFRESQNTTYGSRLAFLRSPVATSSLTALAGSQNESLERTVTSNVRPSLSYKKLFGSRHDIEVNAIGEYIQENYKSFRVTGFGIDPRTPNTIAAVQPGNAANQLFITTGGLTGNNAKQASTLASGLGIFRYTYNSKYTLSGSFRMDGSSKLPPDTRWQSFYSAGFSWEASAEEFINRIKAINTLRLRLSYGGAGNADNFPSNYLYQATYASGSYSGLTTQVASYPGNPAAQWEKTWTSNIGIDFEILNRRIYGDLNWYDKRTKNLFVNRRLPAEAGTFSININAGELQNTGYEWNINADVIRNSKFTWTIFTQGAYNKNKLLSLGGEQPYQSGTSYLKIGLPLGSHYTVKWAGVDAATGQPLYYDLAGHVTTTYNASNSVSDFGTWEAPWKGGFGTNLRYKGLDFSLFFSWQQGAVKSDNLEYFVENPVGFLASGYNQSADLDFWRQPGDIASTPSPLYGTNFASKLLHDASFIRLRDLTIGYTFPKSITDRLKFVSNIKMFVQGSNLFIWTKWRGMDAEAGSVNINLSEFPNPRAFTGGINVTF